MKKLIFLVLIMSFCVTTFAQDESESYESTKKAVFTNKNGIPILPSQGNIAFGTGASPFFNYLGNLFQNDGGNSLTFSEPYIIIKSFVEDNMAYRLKLGANYSSVVNNQYVRDDYAAINDTLSTKQTIDKQNLKNNSIYLEIGVEKRRGNARIQGFYGLGPHVAFSKNVEKYSYGNPMSELNSEPTSYNFEGYNNVVEYGRIVKQHDGNLWSLGLNTFVGVEYFILPKFCLGTQADLNILYSFSGNSEREVEVWDNGKVKTITEQISPGDRSFNVITAHTSLNLFLMFHF